MGILTIMATTVTLTIITITRMVSMAFTAAGMGFADITSFVSTMAGEVLNTGVEVFNTMPGDRAAMEVAHFTAVVAGTRAAVIVVNC